MRKDIIVLGGGTYQPISNHLSLCAPAYGTTGKYLAKALDCELVLTKMADSTSNLKTNEDVENYLIEIIKDKFIKCIIVNVAFCDFKYENGDFHGERLETANGDITLSFKPTNKIIDKIRLSRPDIFLVGFKTTTNKTVDEQFEKGLKMMKRSKCNLVLANDTVTRNNIIITPEETYYGNSTNRNLVLDELVEILEDRLKGTYKRTNFIQKSSINNTETILSKNMSKVMKFLIDNGGFIENNGNGFTPGHFCEKVYLDPSLLVFYSSQRKADHNKVFTEGLTCVEYDIINGTVTAVGSRKPSVGATSQALLLLNNPDYDCIIHTHNPLKKNSKIPTTPQKPYQCGSLECGMNTLTHMVEMENGINAVYLEKHGANILFKKDLDAEKIINFIKENIDLGIKVK